MNVNTEIQLRHVFQITNGATPSSTNGDYWDGDLLWITPQDLSGMKNYWLEDTQRKISESGYHASGTVMAPIHSIALSKRAPIGQLAILKKSACSNQGCFLLIPRIESDSRFFLYWLSCQTKYLQALGRGSTFMELSTDDLKAIRAPSFSPSRQRSIADYLDRETARLDALVTAKERILELLAEKRHALINYFVTRGTDPSVPLRASGMSWPIEIPAHWKTGKLKNFGSFLAGAGFPHEYQGVDGEILPFYKVSDLATSKNNRHMEQSPSTISHDTAAALRAYVVPEGAIVYAKIGAALFLNRRRITTIPCVIDNNMTAYVPSKKTLASGWAFYWTGILDFGIFANPGAVPSLSEGDQAQLPIAIPPITEQRAIIDHLDGETARLDALAVKTHETITLLKERRAAIIAAAVTGEIDVESAA